MSNHCRSPNNEMEQQKIAGIHSIPPEILDEIFGLLVGPPPSLKRLCNLPSHDITHSAFLDLKSFSCVSQIWRQAALPLVFRHARMLLQLDTVHTSWPTLLQAFLEFVRWANLQSAIQSFTLVVQDPQSGRHGGYDMEDSSHTLKDFWRRLFSVINPLRVTVVAPPRIIGFLAALRVNPENSDKFRMPYHILSLDYSLSPKKEQQYGLLDTDAPTLLHIRPWKSILLNEGDFVRGYNTSNYQTFIAKPPSILPSLVTEDPQPRSLLPQNIESVSYIAAFPAAAHISHLRAFLMHIQHLYFQLWPRHGLVRGNNVNWGISDVTHMDAERRTSYELLVEKALSLTSSDSCLTEIECGDTMYDQAWTEVAKSLISATPGYWAMDSEFDSILVRLPESNMPSLHRRGARFGRESPQSCMLHTTSAKIEEARKVFRRSP